MEILLAWVAYLTLGVACLALGWAWLGPRLPRTFRLAVLALCAALAVLALAVTAQIPHDYRPNDLDQYNLGMAALFTGLLVAIAGVIAALWATGRRHTLNAGLFCLGLYVVGVGLVLYLMLNGQPTIHAPALVLVGATASTAAGLRLGGLPRWPARALGLAAGLGAVIVAEGLRGPGSRGGGPAVAPPEIRSLAAIGAVLLLLGGAYLLRSHGRVLTAPLGLAAVGLAGTALVLVLRGPGEWAPTPAAVSTTLYGLPLTLLVIAVSLAIAEAPVLRARVRRPAALSGAPAWSLGVVLPVFLGVIALWRPAPETCVAVPYSGSSPLTPAGPAWAASPDPSAPRGAPQFSDFSELCAHRNPDVSQVVYAYYPSCKWPEVDPTYPLVQATGTLKQIDLSRGDSPWLHTTHDLQLDLDLDEESAWLTVGGKAWELLHAEIEAGSFPVEYRPVPGDRVTVAGRWIFDCGHDPRTEIHPAAVVASEYDDWRADIAGAPQRVKVLRVWMTAAPGVVRVPLAPLDLRVAFPSRPEGEVATPVVQVVVGPPSAVQWAIKGGTGVAEGAPPEATVHIAPPAPDGSAYFELLLGYQEAAPAPDPPIAYTVAFDRLMVHDDLRQKARNTTGIPLDLAWPQLGFPGSGRWTMQAIVNHNWRGLLDFVAVESGDTYSLAGVPPVPVLSASDGRLSLSVTGYAENDPSEGVEMASGGPNRPALLTWDAGPLATLCCGTIHTFTPEHGAWTLSYRVTRTEP